ncbi:hypothetical protein ZWY2020_056075 [Hordeum vulgare]|nr:hypothetical protein ZWY2020_056075 [Hordeum vulgare]
MSDAPRIGASLSSPSLAASITTTTGAMIFAAMPAAASPAINVTSVRTHVPVTLDLRAYYFTKWRMLTCVLLDKYDLLPHILDIIMAKDQTMQEAWTLITNLFLDNEITRVVHLEAEFRGLVQGDLSITTYCHRLKALFDALSNVVTTVSDHTLILN